MDTLYGLLAVGATILVFLLYFAMSNNVFITALVVLQRRLYVSRSRADQERVSQPESLKAINLRLLIERSSMRVLLAECDKSFVDVLFSFLLLPIGKLVRLADERSRIGSVETLYKSVKALHPECFWTSACKNMLLEPRSAYGLQCSSLVARIDQTDYSEYYTCERTPCWPPFRGHSFSSLVKGSSCGCGRAMDRKIQLYADRNNVSAGGFVVRVKRFIVSNDLQVMPVEIDDTRTLLQREENDNNNEVFEKNVHIGLEEVLQLLRRSVVSKTPLTDVFEPNAMTTDDVQLRNLLRERCRYLTGYDFGVREMHVNLYYSMSKEKVVCADTREEFIDFLFSFLTFPIGSIINLLAGRNFSLGSIDNLYHSVEVLNERGNVSRQNTVMLLNPKLERMFSCNNQLLEIEEDATSPLLVNFKRNSLQIVNPKTTSSCPVTRGGGFVKQEGRFLVNDNLSVELLSVFSNILRLYKDFPDLTKLTISVGREEALSLLEAAMTSENVLTRTFWPTVVLRIMQ